MQSLTNRSGAAYLTADASVLTAANLYQVLQGFPQHPEVVLYSPLDEAFACRIADAYEELPHEPTSPAVRQSYQALKNETREQFFFFQGLGYQFEPGTSSVV
jgi:hypothetical protein